MSLEPTGGLSCTFQVGLEYTRFATYKIICPSGDWCIWNDNNGPHIQHYQPTKRCGIVPGNLLLAHFDSQDPVLMLVLAVNNGKPGAAWRGNSKVIGNPKVKEMLIVTGLADGYRLPQSAELRSLLRLGSKAAYDDLQIAMNLSPSPTVWLPVAGGIPMPDSVLNSYQMPARSWSVGCFLKKMMFVGARLRLAMLGPGRASQTWQPYETSIDLCCCLLLKDGDRTRFDVSTRRAADDFERIHGRSPHVPFDAARITMFVR